MTLTDLEIRYKLTHEPEEDLSTDHLDDEAREWIASRLRAGNTWAWCTVIVTAELVFEGHTFIGDDYLGGCSYESESDFRSCVAFEDMKAEARDRLIANARAVVANGERAARMLAAVDRTQPNGAS